MSSLLDETDRSPFAALERLDIDQYHAMIEAGILREGAPIELVDGLLIRKDRRDGSGDIMVVGPRHAQSVKLLLRELTALCSGRSLFVQSQQPVTLGDDSEPEPDVAIIRGAEQDYGERHPAREDVILVCEVADSSLPIDMGAKYAAYAQAGVQEYWVVNLRDRVVEIFVEPHPTDESYAQHLVVHEGEFIEFSLDEDQHVIAVKDILPVKFST